MLRRFNDRGDTIVEVLICAAIITLILSAAFNSSRDSLFQFQQAQERGEATKVIEEQAERLRASASLNTASTSGVFSAAASGNFCVNATLAVQPAPCLNGVEARYETTIVRQPDGRTFTITTNWDRVSGGQETLISAYRVYPR